MKNRLSILTLCLSFLSAESQHFNLFDTTLTEKVLMDKYCQNNSEGEEFCNESSLTYPIVKTKNIKLKKNIEKKIDKHIEEFKKINSKEYVRSILKDMPNTSLSHEDKTEITLHSLTNKIFTLSISNYSYAGGAHGNHSITFYNYKIVNGKLITLKDIILKGYEGKMKKIVETAYRDTINYMPNEDLKNAGWFENNFVLSNSYAIKRKGLEFIYNHYEIKPFVAGVTEFTVSYNKLKSIMNSEDFGLELSTDKPFKQTLKADMGEIGVETKMMGINSIKLKFTMKNLSNNKRGWFSISFPQIESEKTVKIVGKKGFAKVASYKKGSNLYNLASKKGVASKYLLIEGESKKWLKNHSHTITLIVKNTKKMKNLYINLRGSFKTSKEISYFPDYGEDIVTEGQQGFQNYRVRIPLD